MSYLKFLRHKRLPALPWISFISFVILTSLSSFYLAELEEEKRDQSFNFIVQRIRNNINDRLTIYTTLLSGLSALAVNDAEVNIASYENYAGNVYAGHTYRGIQGIGIALKTGARDLSRLGELVRNQKFPEFKMWPEGERSEYFPIIFLYPQDKRNLAAIGYDMFSEPTRRAAMEAARDRGEFAVSGKVQLVQEIDENKQAGFLIYLPLYRGGEVPKTLEERRQNHFGYAYSPFRADDLFRQVFADEDNPPADFAIYDGSPEDANLMHSSRRFNSALPPDYLPVIERQESLSIGGRDWTLRFTSRPAFEAQTSSGYPVSIILFGVAASLLVLWNTSRRLRSEAELIESEERFKVMADSAPVLIWMSGETKGGTYFNKRWLDFTGRSLDQEKGDGWLEHVHPDDMVFLQACEDAFKNRDPFTTQFRLRRHDGNYRYMLDTGVPRFTSDGQFEGYIGSCIDITDIKLYEAERSRLLSHERTLRNQAENASRMKDEFLATISHELRTPLNAVLGWAQLIKQGKLDGPHVQQGIEVIERNARSQARIIEELLDMNRIISGKLSLDFQDVELVKLFEDVLDGAGPGAAAKSISLQRAFSVDHAYVRADPDRLRQVLWNLLSNAIKFTPREGRIELGLKVKNGTVVITVKDSGEGIEKEFLPYVFERFRQADSSTRRKHGGLGLGLAIVKTLVELHGGSVSASSDGHGTGSAFTFTIPLAKSISPHIPEKKEAVNGNGVVSQPPRLDGISVLAVDDEPDARSLLKYILEDNGARVFTAPDVKQALAILNSEMIDVVVSDIGMPDLDGYDFLKMIRSLPGEKGAVPAVAVTAFARADDRVMALK